MPELSTFRAWAVYPFASFKRPIFVLSAPRAGSSFLFELLHHTFLLWGAVRENDTVWWRFFPYTPNDPTDHVTLQEFQARVSPRQLKLGLVHKMLLQRQDALPSYLFRRVFRRQACFLDKTVANAFHLDVLNDVFQDTRFIYLIRDGRANVSSMLEGWKSGVFMKRSIPALAGATIKYWTFPFPPGWQEHARLPLEEICAWSWTEHNRWILDSLERLGLTGRVHVVRYEDLVDDCEQTLKGIEQALHLRRVTADSSALAAVKSWSTVSPPSRDKWKDLHRPEIARIEARIGPMMERLGYAGTQLSTNKR